jgi:hypothetical protein
MNSFYFFIGGNQFCDPIIAIYDILKKNDRLCSQLIDLTSCRQSDRDIANDFHIESSPCLVVCNKNKEILERYYGAGQIVSNLDFLFSKYGI